MALQFFYPYGNLDILYSTGVHYMEFNFMCNLCVVLRKYFLNYSEDKERNEGNQMKNLLNHILI